ncbi:hypothetical protein KOR42_45720 [Thalassoglobus neptunius]|uniref:Tetratricopeptide repeat protein n=1 Tax=Thalassoglobus neptunius TaxID=1938619 RepID=A0A5C5VZW2_9PLAN|nr:hypothetical protein [Thalassoglobus neptunius]TWT43042.1 hypothetical protein KOR42_45720 [Thalassoglobus neptunius]
MSQLRVLGLWLCIIGSGAVGAWGGMWLREALGISAQVNEGMGTVQQSTIDSNESPEDHHWESFDREANSLAESDSATGMIRPESIAKSMSLSSVLKQADQFIVNGNCHAALNVLSQYPFDDLSGLSETEQQHEEKRDAAEKDVELPPEVALRIAICAEELRRDAEACDHYDIVARTSTIPNMRLTAVLGKCRISSRRGDRKLASDVLCHEVLNSTPRDHQRVHERLFHQLAQTISGTTYDSLYDGPLTADLVLVRPETEITAEDLLFDATELERQEPPSFESPQSVRTTLRLDDEVEGIYVSMRFEDAPVNQILHDLCQEIHLELQLGEGIRETCEKRITTTNVSELPVSILLDALLLPMGFQWEQSGEIVRVWSLPENTETENVVQREQARRLLRYCSTVFPHHSSAMVSRLHRVAFDVRAEELSSAKNELDALVLEAPSGRLRDAAWFNLGKWQLLNEDVEAADSFFRVLDVGTTSEIDAAACCLLGRLLLREDRAREAVVPLRKGLNLTGETIYRSQIRLLLASALLLSGEPVLANEVLVEESPSNDLERAQSAFLIALTRLQQATQIGGHEELAADLLRAYSNLNLTEAKEEHWYYLAAIAAKELGFLNESQRLYTEARQTWPETDLRKKFDRLFDGQGDDFSRVQQVAHSDPSGGETFVVVNGDESEEELEEKYQACLRVILQQSGEQSRRREALRTMGRIEQLRGNHREAVRCFSGVVPKSIDPESSPGSQSPDKE